MAYGRVRRGMRGLRRGLGQDDLSSALSDFAKLGSAGGPTGGGTAADLLQSVATNPAYQGSIPAPTFWSQYGSVVLIGGAVFFGLMLLGGRR